MQVEVPKEVSDKLTTASKLLGIEKRQLVDRALVVYLDSLSRYLDLKQEIKEWDALSDEALRSFERSL